MIFTVNQRGEKEEPCIHVAGLLATLELQGVILTKLPPGLQSCNIYCPHCKLIWSLWHGREEMLTVINYIQEHEKRARSDRK